MARSIKPKSHEALGVTDLRDQVGKLKFIAGSNSDDFNSVLINQAVSTWWLGPGCTGTPERHRQAVVAVMMGISPRDEIEGMLAAQMVGLHSATVECLRRANIEDQTFEGRQESLNHANKLARTFTMFVEALDRHRGKGQQKVTVEHIHVHQGAQANVGTINHREADRFTSQGEEQPDAARAIAYEPSTPMRCANPLGDALPIASGSGQDPVPDARRCPGQRGASRQPKRAQARPPRSRKLGLAAGTACAPSRKSSDN